jgi:single-strand selective monofunctional uracil DNA glycosylase
MLLDYVTLVDRLNQRLAKLRFAAPVTHVYNPLVYARAPHLEYVARYAQRGVPTLWLGMNPGPWGMAQTGVPFGEVALVRDWLGISGTVGKPKGEHPARPILGFSCARSEVSGARLWGLARSAFGEPARFFEHFFVVNYCPLVFMEESGKNFTPDKLPPHETAALYAACDDALRAIVALLEPKAVVGVGAFAEARAKSALEGLGLSFGRILHPSPASPLANKDWPGEATKALRKLGCWPGA